MTEVAGELEQILADTCLGEHWLDFEALLQIKNDRVGLFWALLLLSAQSKIELEQKEFYQDIRLRPFQPIKEAELPIFNSATS